MTQRATLQGGESLDSLGIKLGVPSLLMGTWVSSHCSLNLCKMRMTFPTCKMGTMFSHACVCYVD